MKPKHAKHYLALITTIAVLFLSSFGFVFQNLYTARFNRITQYELMGRDIVTVTISAIFVYIILFQDYQKLKINKTKWYLVKGW